MVSVAFPNLGGVNSRIVPAGILERRHLSFPPPPLLFASESRPHPPPLAPRRETQSHRFRACERVGFASETGGCLAAIIC